VHDTTILTIPQLQPTAQIDAFDVYLCWCSTPNGANRDKITTFASIGKEQRKAAKIWLKSDAWKKWHEEVAGCLQKVADCLQDEVPSVIEAWNMTILELFNKYSDSMCVQAKISSMMYKYMLQSDDSKELKNTLYASTAGTDDPNFVLSVFNVLSSPHAIRMCGSDIYADVIQLLHMLLTSCAFDRSKVDATATYYANVDAVLDTCFTILNKIYDVQHARTSNKLCVDPSKRVECLVKDSSLVGTRNKKNAGRWGVVG